MKSQEKKYHPPPPGKGKNAKLDGDAGDGVEPTTDAVVPSAPGDEKLQASVEPIKPTAVEVNGAQ